MDERHYLRARVSIIDEMVVKGETYVGEDGEVIVIDERNGKQVVSHIKNCVITEL